MLAAAPAALAAPGAPAPPPAPAPPSDPPPLAAPPAPGTPPVPVPGALAPSAPAPAARPVALRLGARGAVVRDLQRELRRRGNPRLRVDGTYGPATRAAVRTLQRRLHLPPTGVANAALLRRLGIQTLRAAAAAPAPVVTGPVRMPIWPTSGTISSPFGRRWGRMHEGLDIAGVAGTPAVTPLPGRVTFAGWYGGYGWLVRVDHGNGIETRYAHLQAPAVQPGQTVLAGDTVGFMGSSGNSTGTHLHFEVRIGGRAVDPGSALPPGARPPRAG